MTVRTSKLQIPQKQIPFAGALFVFLATACDGSISGHVAIDQDFPEMEAALVVNTGQMGIPLRLEPSTDAKQAARIPEKSYVIVEEKEDTWRLISYVNPITDQEHVGWVKKGKLNLHDGPPPQPGHNFMLPYPSGKNYRFSTVPGPHSHHKTHSKWGWDVAMKVGDKVVAAHDGKVRTLRKGSTAGACLESYMGKENFVALDRGDGLETLYVHLKKVFVKKGQHVKRGDPIGTIGLTGYVCGAHLHFQIQKTGPANQSVESNFWDKGKPFSPKLDSVHKSQNNKNALIP